MPIIYLMKIGNKLKSLRVRGGFSTIQVAEMLEVSKSTYRRYETDKVFPDIFIFDKITKIYQIHFIELLPEKIKLSISELYSSQTNTDSLTQISQKLIQQYEERIEDLEGQVDFWKAKELKK